MRGSLPLMLVLAWVATSIVVPCRADQRQEAALEVPPALARIDALLTDGDAMAALEEIVRLAARHGEDPLYGWQIADRRGVALLGADRAAEALPLLEATVVRSPLAPSAHRNLANALRRLGRRGRALAEYQQVVELAPGDADHRLEHAHYLLEFRMWRRAEAEFRAARRLCRCPEADRGLAETLLRQGRPGEAVEPLRRIHGADPTRGARRDLLAALQGAGRDSAIVALLGDVAPADLSRDEALALVQAEGALGDGSRHSLAFVVDRAVPAADGSAVFWGRITLNLLAAGHLEEALTAAGRAVDRNPREAAYLQNRAAVLSRLGRNAEAQRDLDEVARLKMKP